MATVKPRVDVVIVGMGWTGSIMAKQMTDAGLSVVGLERGADRDTQPDFAYPKVADELEGSVHRKFLQSLSQETVTVRHGPAGIARALPSDRIFQTRYRRGRRRNPLVGLPFSCLTRRLQTAQQRGNALRSALHSGRHDHRGLSGQLP